MRGRIIQINVKPRKAGERGLPKFAVRSAEIKFEGLVGDFNVWRHEKMGDDPNCAVLLMPIETIEEINREGWPIKPGDIGENITTSGIAYDGFALNARIGAGRAEFQISKACDPCVNLFRLPYVGKKKGKEFLKTMYGRRGWYARVIKEGKIQTGDEIVSAY
jgi:MOSC domain-containing protein YiiM